jgi:hypothetical protein
MLAIEREDCNKAIAAKALVRLSPNVQANPKTYGQSASFIEPENGSLISFEKPLKNA